MAQSLNVCVVGAGMSGLVAIKELLDEGHRVTCFERTTQVGGNFNYPIGAAYDSMSLTVSQYHMAFSCFPPPLGDERRFWRREEYAAYLRDFAAQFTLLPHIKFETEIVTIQRGANNDQFRVTSRDKQTGTVTETVFDAVASALARMPSTSPASRNSRAPTRFKARSSIRCITDHLSRSAASTSCVSVLGKRLPTSRSRSPR